MGVTLSLAARDRMFCAGIASQMVYDAYNVGWLHGIAGISSIPRHNERELAKSRLDWIKEWVART